MICQRRTDSISRAVKEAEKKSDRNEAESTWAEWQAMRAVDKDEVDRLTTIYWEKRARDYRVPMPEYKKEPYRVESDVKQVSRLTVDGIDFIEERIDEKRNHKWGLRLQIIGAFTGLISALAGLAAIRFAAGRLRG